MPPLGALGLTENAFEKNASNVQAIIYSTTGYNFFILMHVDQLQRNEEYVEVQSLHTTETHLTIPGSILIMQITVCLVTAEV